MKRCAIGFLVVVASVVAGCEGRPKEDVLVAARKVPSANVIAARFDAAAKTKAAEVAAAKIASAKVAATAVGSWNFVADDLHPNAELVEEVMTFHSGGHVEIISKRGLKVSRERGLWTVKGKTLLLGMGLNEREIHVDMPFRRTGNRLSFKKSDGSETHYELLESMPAPWKQTDGWRPRDAEGIQIVAPASWRFVPEPAKAVRDQKFEVVGPGAAKSINVTLVSPAILESIQRDPSVVEAMANNWAIGMGVAVAVRERIAANAVVYGVTVNGGMIVSGTIEGEDISITALWTEDLSHRPATVMVMVIGGDRLVEIEKVLKSIRFNARVGVE